METEPARIIQGRCPEALMQLADDSIDLIVTSPPYADRRASTYGGTPPEQYVAWFLPIADQLHRVLKPTGSFILNIKESAVKGERHTYVLELILALRKREQRPWLWTEELVWHKRNCYPGKWPNRFRDSWERLLQFNKQRGYYRNPEFSGASAEGNQEDEQEDEINNGLDGNVLQLATECGNAGHSAAFPEELPAWFIERLTRPSALVLDPFAGSGTTLLAALRLGRNSVGVEPQDKYCQVIRQRLEGETRRLL